MGIPADILRATPALNEWTILSGYIGSLAHGTWQPSSEPTSVDDRDVMAICVPPLEYYLGLKTFGSRGTMEVKRDIWDIVIYEARKALGLLSQGNPNVLGLLWLPENCYLNRSAAGQLILTHRSMFVGKHVYNAFIGYAHGQLHRMTHGACLGYMGEKRKSLVERFGYDTKNAAHLIRLLRMGIEFLATGELNVRREDAPQLLEIKRGEWSLERVQSEADELFRRAQEALITSKLPTGPDREHINDLCCDVVMTAWKERGVYAQ